jgi:hypothetical protein
MKIKVSEKTLDKMEDYFKSYATGVLNKKTLSQLSFCIGISKRHIRKGIELLKIERSIPISAEVKSGGYFVVEHENKLDFEKMDIYKKRQQAKAIRILQGLKVFDQFYPEGQQLMDFPEAKALTY